MARLPLIAAAAAAALALAACTPMAPPRRAASPAPPPRPAPPPPAADWRDRPLSAGGWSYAADAGGSVARFGSAGAPPAFVLRCERGGRTVALARAGAAAGTLTIETSYGVQGWPATPAAGGTVVARLAAADTALDRLAFSRGRFRVALPGTAELILPAWAEPARVIEDCRG